MKEPFRVQEKWWLCTSLDITIVYIQAAPGAKEFLRYPVCPVSVPTDNDGLLKPPRCSWIAPDDEVVVGPHPTPMGTRNPLFRGQFAH